MTACLHLSPQRSLPSATHPLLEGNPPRERLRERMGCPLLTAHLERPASLLPLWLASISPIVTTCHSNRVEECCPLQPLCAADREVCLRLSTHASPPNPSLLPQQHTQMGLVRTRPPSALALTVGVLFLAYKESRRSIIWRVQTCRRRSACTCFSNPTRFWRVVSSVGGIVHSTIKCETSPSVLITHKKTSRWRGLHNQTEI
jgi:hypothetical protein